VNFLANVWRGSALQVCFGHGSCRGSNWSHDCLQREWSVQISQPCVASWFATMELLLLQYMSLFYVVLFYSVWKRWHRSLSVGGGHKTMKRLRRCAPQVLVRAARQQRQCEIFLDSCLQRRQWLHYGFCYYYGGHARHISSWLVAAGTLYCLWNNVHASSASDCYALSVIAFAGMTVPYRYGPYMGMMLALSMPAFMPCEICPPHYTAEACVEFQRNNGCHACARLSPPPKKTSCFRHLFFIVFKIVFL